jgi:hypothetical protein
MLRLATLTAALALVATAALAQAPTQTVSTDITTNSIWTTGSVVLMDGLIYVRPGATLTIQPGVIVKGKAAPSAGTGDLASGLVVMQGGRLIAAGEANSPIIFTAEADNVADRFDLDETNRGLWGGVILLGRATNNRGIRNIEGIPVSDDTRYGCDGATIVCDDNDDSGTLRYVSIRHAGFGFQPNSEINGLTMGAVGRGTTVEYVEVFANSDDSYEFFGGTVNTRWLVAAFSGDDEFDWDTGYTGFGQWWFSIKDSTGETGRCFEADGAASPFTATPLSNPTITNLTCIGAGVAGTPGGSEAGSPALLLRENTQGKLYNSVITDWNNLGLQIEDTGDPLTSSRSRFDDGTLDLRNNIWFGFGAGNTWSSLVEGTDATLEAALEQRNTLADPQLVAIARDQSETLDPRPMPGAPPASGSDFSYTLLQNPFFTPTTYRGAFSPDGPTWLAGEWSVLATNGYLSGAATPVEGSPRSATLTIESVRPNPIATSSSVAFSLPQAGAVRLALLDITGREVAVLVNSHLSSGTHSVNLDASPLASGVYVLRLTGDAGSMSRRIVVGHR